MRQLREDHFEVVIFDQKEVIVIAVCLSGVELFRLRMDRDLEAGHVRWFEGCKVAKAPGAETVADPGIRKPGVLMLGRGVILQGLFPVNCSETISDGGMVGNSVHTSHYMCFSWLKWCTLKMRPSKIKKKTQLNNQSQSKDEFSPCVYM